jgi:hypothetical protein
MASIVAYIELREGALTAPSLFAIAEARRIAQSVGATVYAFLPVGPMSHVQIDQLAEEISSAGADRILCSSDETLAGPALDASHGGVLAQIAEHLRPLLFLFPAGGVGVQLGPPLAVRIGAAYAAWASIVLESTIDTEPTKRVIVERWRGAGNGLRRIDVGDLERPVVAVLAAGPRSLDLGEPCAEVEMVPCPTGKPTTIRLLKSDPDEGASLESCARMVCLPPETPDEDVTALRAALSPDDCVRKIDANNLYRATPTLMLMLATAGRPDAPAPVRARTMARVTGAAADLTLALQRLPSSGETVA